MKYWSVLLLSSLCAVGMAQTYSSSVDMSQYTQISGTPAKIKTVPTDAENTNTEIRAVITLGLGEGPNGGYVGISRAAVAQLKEVQAQHDESLSSDDVIKILGTPQSEYPQETGACKEGGTGEKKTFSYLIKEGYRPIYMAVIPFCNDGMQSVSIQRIP